MAARDWHTLTAICVGSLRAPGSRCGRGAHAEKETYSHKLVKVEQAATERIAAPVRTFRCGRGMRLPAIEISEQARLKKNFQRDASRLGGISGTGRLRSIPRQLERVTGTRAQWAYREALPGRLDLFSDGRSARLCR